MFYFIDIRNRTKIEEPFKLPSHRVESVLRKNDWGVDLEFFLFTLALANVIIKNQIKNEGIRFKSK